MIRFIFAVIVLVLYFIITLPIYIILWIIGKFSPKTRQKVSQAFVRCGFSFILWIAGAKMDVRGLENVPKDTPVLYISNHQSILEALVGYALVKGPMGFVAKNELKKAPFLKQWMDSVHCLFIDRNDMKQSMKTILAAIEEVKNGTSIWICPEGTRNKTPEEVLTQEFKDGSFKIADRTKCPVVPVAVNGTWACFERQFPKMRKSHVTVSFGTPFLMADLDKDTKKHVGEYARNIVDAMLIEDRERVK